MERTEVLPDSMELRTRHGKILVLRYKIMKVKMHDQVAMGNETLTDQWAVCLLRHLCISSVSKGIPMWR